MTMPIRILLATAGLLLAQPVGAQGFLRRARDAARRGVENTVERAAEDRATRATEGAIGAAEGAVTGDRTGSAPSGAPADASVAPAGAFVNYDFVPGERVLFADDFEADRTGDFPARLTFAEGNAETAEWQGRRLLRMTSFGAFAVTLPAALPDRFTLEFDMAAPAGWNQEVRFSDDASTYVSLSPWGGGLDGDARARVQFADGISPAVLFPVKVMADGDHVKVYIDGRRVANVPTAALGRSRQIRFDVRASDDHPVYVGAIRVAEGGRELVQIAAAVATADAPVVLTGVVFDTGRATLRPESGPTLDAVAASLAAHPDVRVRVEGHTDATGSAETNRRLSGERARAVAEALAARGVASGRMEATGVGPDRPVADNATAEGRQQNRRVALVRF